TCASLSPVFNMQTVSWLVMSGAGPLLSPGMKPSAIAQCFRPIALIGRSFCSQSFSAISDLYDGLRPHPFNLSFICVGVGPATLQGVRAEMGPFESEAAA